MTSSSRLRRAKRETTNTAASLPSDIQNLVPSCAQKCFAEYVHQEFECTSSTSCLCSATGKNGFTLGEIAYACISNICTDPSIAAETTAYEVCDKQVSAASPTHNIITLPVLKTTTPTGTSSPIPNVSAQAVTTTEAKASPTVSEGSSSSGPHLTPAQNAGIAVGITACLAIAIGLIIFLRFLQKRRLQRYERTGGSDDYVEQEQSDNKAKSAIPGPTSTIDEKIEEEKSTTPIWYRSALAFAKTAEKQKKQHEHPNQATEMRITRPFPEKPRIVPPKRNVRKTIIISPGTVIEDSPMSEINVQPSVPAQTHIPTQPQNLPTNVPRKLLLLDIPKTATRNPASNSAEASANGQSPASVISALYRSLKPLSRTASTSSIFQKHSRQYSAASQVTIATPAHATRVSTAGTLFEDENCVESQELHRVGSVSQASRVQYPKIPQASNIAANHSISAGFHRARKPSFGRNLSLSRKQSISSNSSEMYTSLAQSQLERSTSKINGPDMPDKRSRRNFRQSRLESRPSTSRGLLQAGGRKLSEPSNAVTKPTYMPKSVHEEMVISNPLWMPKITQNRSGDEVFVEVHLTPTQTRDLTYS